MLRKQVKKVYAYFSDSGSKPCQFCLYSLCTVYLYTSTINSGQTFHSRAFPDSVDVLVLQFCHFPFDIKSKLGGNSSSAQMQTKSFQTSGFTPEKFFLSRFTPNICVYPLTCIPYCKLQKGWNKAALLGWYH